LTTILGIDETKLAECVGLWLAEGDSKTDYEITLTNNCWSIITHFHSLMEDLFKDISPRIYVYFPNKELIRKMKSGNIRFRYYVDNRATKPYYIYRIANAKLIKIWKNMVENVKQELFFKHILRGFFAGEGNIKIGSKRERLVRISQGKRNEFLEKILRYFDIGFRYDSSHRQYEISNRKNLEKIDKLGVTLLHPEKRIKFDELIKSYKQYHYPRRYLKSAVRSLMKNHKEFYTSRELSYIFKRDVSRIQMILTQLKSDGDITNFRVCSKDYWIGNSGIILISNIKQRILDSLELPKKTSEISNETNKSWKATYRRLLELENLNLVRRHNYLWHKIPLKKEVRVI